MTFIDSNVLIYAADDTDIIKQRVARSIVGQALASEKQVYCGMKAVNPFKRNLV